MSEMAPLVWEPAGYACFSSSGFDFQEETKATSSFKDRPSDEISDFDGHASPSDGLMLSQFINFCAEIPADCLIFTDNSLSLSLKNDIAEYGRVNGIGLYQAIFPNNFEAWLPDFNYTGPVQIKPLHITDLFKKAEVYPVPAEVIALVRGKKVLITGAAGSIGSELSALVLSLAPSGLLLLDRAETPLVELTDKLLNLRINLPKMNNGAGAQPYSLPCLPQPILTDLTRSETIKMLLVNERPDIIIHAAAYKHVPIMEEYPEEAFRNNTLATYNLAKSAQSNGCQLFILVSSDKAVNPVSVMGISKRLAEKALLTLSRKPGICKFATVRFGNVMGSNGSVVPVFEKQIANGGPVTVTDINIHRYFVGLPAACRLILSAASIAQGGDIFVFDMGEPVSILNLARKMIELNKTLYPKREIPLVITELRKGEKQEEELLYPFETKEDTRFPAIFRIDSGPKKGNRNTVNALPKGLMLPEKQLKLLGKLCKV